MTSVRVAVAAALQAAAAERDALSRVNRTLRNSSTGTALAALAVSIGLSGAAYAQQAPAPSDTGPAAATVDEVTVTGSRIRRTTDFDTANPTTVVDANYLQNLGVVNVGAAIAQLPSNVSNNTPTTTGNANFFTGSTIANLRGLNPFFGSRTLTLVNTRRFVPTNQGDGVDLNFIPSVMINRVDVVTGGASAAYGSGAVSGVQNIFLNTKLEGGKAEVDYQQSAHSDGKDKHVGIAFGHGFADGRGHFVLGGEYEDMDAVGCIDARDFCAKNQGFYQNTGNPTGPLFVRGENLRGIQQSQTGVLFDVFSGPTTVYQANAAGTGLQNFNLGLLPNSAISPFNVAPGGDGPAIYAHTNLRAPVDRKVATGTFTFALTDTLNLNADASWGKVTTTNQTAALASNFVAVSYANPFAAPLLAAAGVPNVPGPPTFVNKLWDSQSQSFTTFDTKVKRASLGLDGKFGDSTWTWDAYYQVGRTERSQLVHDNLHNNATSLALNVVTGPNGQPICAVNAPGAVLPTGIDPALAAACVPVNPFGNAALTPAQKAYIFGNLDEVLDYTQQVWAANASGELFEGFGAGTISGAIGIEHRDELGHNLENGAGVGPDIPAYIRTDYLIQYGEPFSGKVKVDEIYAEVNLPVLKDAPGAKKLEFDISARESRYRNQGLAGTQSFEGVPFPKASHNLTTWKISAIYDPIELLRFRGSQSRDARAPNFRELYYGQKIGAGGLFGYCDPFGTGSRNDPCNWSLEGNTALRPEKSDTTTLGIVVSPPDTGLQFAVDYFRINIKEAIEQAQIQGVFAGCQLANDPRACALIQFDPTDTYTQNGQTFRGIQNVRAQSFNGAAYRFKGIDFTGSWSKDLANGSNLNVRLLAEHMIDQVFQSNPAAAPINIVGQTGLSNAFLSDNQPTAKWTGSLTGTYTMGAWGLTGQMRYVSDGIIDYNAANGTTATGVLRYDVTKVPSYQVFTLSSQYTFSDLGGVSSLQVYGVVDNLFDKKPPFANGSGAFGVNNATQGGTNSVFYDALGRMFRLGVRMQF